MDELRAAADARFQVELERSGARDPREFYRETLRSLREQDASAYRRALEYYETTLLPEAARENGDPIGAWLEYGRYLASLTAPGEAVQVDPTGRRLPYAPPVPLDHLVLYLPTAMRQPAMAIGLPPSLSDAQRAAFALLVQRKPLADP
jgi:hypothetical protein